MVVEWIRKRKNFLKNTLPKNKAELEPLKFMARNIAVGIDIGTHQIKVMVTEKTSDKNGAPLEVLGVGMAESNGLRYGYIVNRVDVTRSLKKAVEQAEKTSGIKIKSARLGIGGVTLESAYSSGSTIISRADSEITDLDLEKAINDAEEKVINKISKNKKILHTIPIEYFVDGKKLMGRPQGLRAEKLEVQILSITYLEQHLEDLIEAVEDIGIEVIDVIAAPIAASLVTLSKTQKVAGCVLANIGAETVSVVVYENNLPISLKIFPIGSNDITNDIALGLKIPIEEAEEIKKGRLRGVHYTQKELDEIISARLSDIFELIQAHLKEISKNELLPAGIILTGGGSGIQTIEDIAKASLKLPSRKAQITSNNSRTSTKDSSWAVVYGLCVIGLSEEVEPFGIQVVKETKGSLIKFIKKFLP